MLHDHARSFDSTAVQFTGERRSLQDRRGEQRHIALLRVALLHSKGSRDLCVVKNISPSGLSVRVYRNLASGDEVEIEFRSGELLAGSVVWEKDWDVGISFPNPIDVEAVLASRWIIEAGRGRNLPRIDIDLPARVAFGTRMFEARLQDISQSGARVRMEEAVPVHAKVDLSLAELPPAAGVVRWTRGAEIGISFNECIPFERLAHWIYQHRSDSSQESAAARAADDLPK